MSTQAPEWRKRTRPCPFYSQGRCLFADSCNFLHDIKVKSAADQLVLDATYAKPQMSSPSRNVLNPPSLVITPPSSPSANLSSRACDSSRYSGLLSVLQDVIGPGSNVQGNNITTSDHEGPDDPALDIQDSTYRDNILPQGWDETIIGLHPSGIDADRCIAVAVETTHQDDRSMTSLAVHALTQSPLSDAVDLLNNLNPNRDPASPSSPEEDIHPTTTFISYLVEEDVQAEDCTGFVESKGHDLASSDVDAVQDSDPAVTPSRRDSHATSVVSAFSGDGASLLASPRGTPLRSFPIRNSSQASPSDILSPVELSARLRPFSIHMVDTSWKRGDSIDSGYADGEGWINPFPFSRSPPRSVRSSTGSITCPPRRSSLVFPAMQERRVSYDVRPIRPSPGMTILAIEENTLDTTSEESEDGDACSVFGAYGLSPSEDQQDLEIDCPSPTLRMSTMQTAEGRLGTRDAIESPCPPVSRFAAQPANGTEESSAPPSFNTAHSPRCSSEDLSDVSAGVSPVRQDSLLSFISGRSSPNTSVLSPDSDAPKLLGEASLCDISDLRKRQSSASDRQEDISSGTSSSNSFSPPTSASDVGEELGYLSPGAVDAEQSQTARMDFGESACFGDPNACGDHPELDVQEDAGGEENSSTDSFDSEYHGFFTTSPSQFPLPPTHIPTDPVRDVESFTDDEDTCVSSIVQDSDALGYRKWPTFSGAGHNAQRKGTGSSLTITTEVDTSFIIPSESESSKATFSSRGRAASDITVKGLSARPEEEFASTTSMREVDLPLSEEEHGWSDSVQSLYDHYLDGLNDGASDYRLGSPDSSHENRFTMYLPVTGQHTQTSRSDSETSHPHSSDPAPDEWPVPSASIPIHSPTDCSGSRTMFRPFLTGRRSILDSSFPADLIPQLNAAERSPALSSTTSVRLQTKEIGSTMVPFGFRRYNAQFAAKHSLQSFAQPPHSAPPQTESRETLRIRTDITEPVSLPRCFSAEPASARSPLQLQPKQSQCVPQSGELKSLRLSVLVNTKRSSLLSSHSSSIASSIMSPDHILYPSTPQSASVSSVSPLSRKIMLSSPCHALIPEHNCNTQPSGHNSPLSTSPEHFRFPSNLPLSCRDSRSISAPAQQSDLWRLSRYRAGSRGYSRTDADRRVSRASTISLSSMQDEEEPADDNPTVSHPMSLECDGSYTRRPASPLVGPVHAIATPKPTLLFAIASDNVDQVRKVLDSGEAGPNDLVGPQSALAFTLTSCKLAHKNEIVKALLAYGADPSALRNPVLNPSPRVPGDETPPNPPAETTSKGMDPATRYFVARADSPHARQTSQLMYRSFFRPLARVRYDVIGQDWALEQLFRALSMHSHQFSVYPIVVLLCGPSGHGKSLLARKFGSLLGIPTHTVNMTTLRSTHDIWQSFSMSPYEEPSSCTLAQFLVQNEGKRCVVVLDEIEKTEDQRALWSLLMPWELGRCSLEVGKRNVDVRSVVWLGTSNIGHDLVFEHHESRPEPEKQMTREEYLELTNFLRPRVSQCLGASLLSRVTAVLPFVPFTEDEKKAIAAEAVYMLGGDSAAKMTPSDVESVVMRALPSYCPGEGARSLHRAVSNQLMDVI